MDKKTVTLGDILTAKETRRALELYREVYANNQLETKKEFRSFAQEVCKELIEPNMARINKNLGQENVPMYLAYLVEFVLSSTIGDNL